MALNITKSFDEVILTLKNPEEGMFSVNHVFEPEFHQDKYVLPCKNTSKLKDAFQIGNSSHLVKEVKRGMQPTYIDDETDLDSLLWEGMLTTSGKILNRAEGLDNVCVLKSISIRFGYIDFDQARAVSRDYYDRNCNRAGVKKDDVLINSTGDGTIGRVAVYNKSFPALVDGHITILRFDDPIIAWYTAAYLLSPDGQNQIYRYINGSSGQVEIYPQDIERIWIKPASYDKMKEIYMAFKSATEKYELFNTELRKALYQI